MKASIADYETQVSDLADLRAFVLTSNLKSLTAAAKLTGESKATISRRISRLEAALGTSLLRRSPRAVETTEDGAAYRVRVAEVLELMGDANAAVRGSAAEPSGQLRVTAPPGFNDALAPIFARFSEQYPQVLLTVHVASRFVDIEAEHFDVALRATARLADSTLIAHRVGEADFVRIAVASPAYLKAHPAPRKVQDLAQHRIISTGETAGTSTVEFTRTSTGERTLLSLTPAITGTDIGFVKDMVLAGAGISLLPHLLMRKELEDGSLVQVLSGYTAPGANLYLLHRGGRFVPPKVRAFREFVAKSLNLCPTTMAEPRKKRE